MIRMISIFFISIILVKGFLIPGYQTLQETVAQEQLNQLIAIESTAIEKPDYSQLQQKHPKAYQYLMSHPKVTLKICLQTPNDSNCWHLSNDALMKMGLEPVSNEQHWDKVLKQRYPQLFTD